MSTAPTPRAYPLPRPDDDPRFSLGLIVDVARVLAERGYAEITAGGDLVALQQALFGFLYASPACTAGDVLEPLAEPAPDVDGLAHRRAGAVAMLAAAGRRTGTDDGGHRWADQAARLRAEIARIDRAAGAERLGDETDLRLAVLADLSRTGVAVAERAMPIGTVAEIAPMAARCALQTADYLPEGSR